MNNSPNNSPKVFGFNLDFITTLIIIIGGTVGYILNNQISLEKRLTTVEVKGDNQSATYDDLKKSIEVLDFKIDKLIESGSHKR
jgi:cell division septal protein FtsQ